MLPIVACAMSNLSWYLRENMFIDFCNVANRNESLRPKIIIEILYRGGDTERCQSVLDCILYHIRRVERQADTRCNK